MHRDQNLRPYSFHHFLYPWAMDVAAGMKAGAFPFPAQRAVKPETEEIDPVPHLLVVEQHLFVERLAGEV